MQRPYDLKYERKLTNAVSWPCRKGNIRERMSSLAVFWKEPIWIELQRCWPHIRVSVKSKSRNSNRSSFGSCVPTWKAILRYVKLRTYKQNLLLKLFQSSNSKTTTKTNKQILNWPEELIVSRKNSKPFRSFQFLTIQMVAVMLRSHLEYPTCECVHSYLISPCQTPFWNTSLATGTKHWSASKPLKKKYGVHTGTRCPLCTRVGTGTVPEF